MRWEAEVGDPGVGYTAAETRETLFQQGGGQEASCPLAPTSMSYRVYVLFLAKRIQE